MSESPPSPERMAAWRAFLWANTLIMRRFRNDLRARDLSLEEFDVLIHLAETEGGGLPLHELAESLVLGDGLTRSGLTRLLDRMERAGWIERQLNRQDRRRFNVLLTKDGRGLFERVWPEHVIGIERYFFDPLVGTELTQLGNALHRLVEANG